ncbi:pyridoxamine 5'-phosphate oxidase family protein [Rhodococcus sp. NPDC059968]|uniref:pyridoxamine 5'-phosphate oxidase family protein n=1 Tax=Rhodococcus sp. NPDC059968 TaxID=3347017 RepID=UPI00366E7332
MASSDGRSPYHPGEDLVQRSVGQLEVAARRGIAIRREIPPALAHFVQEQPRILLGGIGNGNLVWATVMVGPVGFVKAIEPGVLRIAGRPTGHDPLADLADGSEVGSLVIDLATRRRARLNGRAWIHEQGIDLNLDQVYPNCAQHIRHREWNDSGTEYLTGCRSHELSERQRALIADTEMFFVASIAPGEGADISHRGGPRGFVTSSNPHSIEFDDYDGNAMFNTLGNLQQDDRIGLLIVDSPTCSLIHISGTASWKKTPTGRRVFVAVQQVLDRSSHERDDSC